MCKFFSFVTEPEGRGGKRYYFDWEARTSRGVDDGCDSHSVICKTFLLYEDKCNKYEYDPLLKTFEVDQINSPIDDRAQAEEWVRNMEFKRIIEPLIIKEIVNPLNLPKIEVVTEEHKQLLKQWASVWDSVGASVGASVWASVGASVGDSAGASVWASAGASVWASVWASVGASVGASVWDSVGDSVWASVGASVWAYVSSFCNIQYKYDFSPLVKLWEAGLVPSYDDKIWRLHTGKDATVVYEWQL